MLDYAANGTRYWGDGTLAQNTQMHDTLRACRVGPGKAATVVKGSRA